MGKPNKQGKINFGNITPKKVTPKVTEPKVEDVKPEVTETEIKPVTTEISNETHEDIHTVSNETSEVTSATNVEEEVDESKLEKVDLNEVVKTNIESTRKGLETRATLITNHANDIDNNLESMSDEEVDEYIEVLASEVGISSEELSGLIVSDLPASDIIQNIPVRVIEQILKQTMVTYPLSKYQRIVFRSNGIVDIDYKDYTDNDSNSGYSNVIIDDYNKGLAPIFRETYQVDTETSKGYDMLDTLLNDITMTTGAFIALLSDFSNNVLKPLAKFFYIRHIKFLDNTEVDKEVLFGVGATIKDKAKQVLLELLSLQTPSRNNLTVKPDGSTTALEYTATRENTIIVMDVKYAAEYKYDLTAGTFQLGEIQLPVSDVLVVDFAKLAEYSPFAKNLVDVELIVFDKNMYEEFVHYTTIKITDTPKLKKVINTYSRVGNLRYKNAFYFTFKTRTE